MEYLPKNWNQILFIQGKRHSGMQWILMTLKQGFGDPTSELPKFGESYLEYLAQG